MRKLIISLLLLIVILPASAQKKSVKRGVGWHEASQPFTEAVIQKLAPGVAWVYNWGQAPTGRPASLGSGKSVEYVPMCWNNNFDETKLRNWLNDNPGTKYLLGYNEPNFSAQANMTPASAAAAWPRVEAIAKEYGLKLVAPVLNFTGEKVGGRTWSPYEWLDEFVRLYPDARMDCLALHCYMNWSSSLNWFATEYFYADLFNPSKTDVYGKYPNLAAYLTKYKETNGQYPRMMLTEFCAWENDGTIKNVDFQLDQMTQKVQYLEKSDLVEGYAWFLGNSNASAYPYMSLQQTNSASSELSELGKVYVYMSAFDTDKYYTPGEVIAAKDYVDATLGDQQVKLRSNSDATSEQVLQVEFAPSASATYQVELPYDDTYTLSLRMKSDIDNAVRVYCDGIGSTKRYYNGTLPSTSGAWKEQTIEFEKQLKAGKHTITLYSMSLNSFFVNQLELTSTTGISSPTLQTTQEEDNKYYSISGIATTQPQKGIYIHHGKKIIHQ